MMESLIGDWYARHITGDLAPMPDASDADKRLIAELYPPRPGQVIQLDSLEYDGGTHDLAELMREREALKAEIKPVEARVKHIENVLRMACGTADQIDMSDGSTYTNRMTSSQLIVDIKALRAAEPERYAQLIADYPYDPSYRRPYYRPAKQEVNHGQ